MQRAKKRFLTLVALLPFVLLVATWLYMLGMARLEGEPRDFWRALGFAAETITTTGYGSDVTWSHPAMVVYVVALQFFGVVLMYMFIPLYLIQFLEERFGTKTGAIVIGQWVQGHLEPQPTASGRLRPHGILVAVGCAESLEKLRRLAGSRRTARPQGPFLIAGYGEVGQKVGQLLRDAGEEIRVIDLHDAEGVDAVGDILDPRVLESLEPAESPGIILALDSDRATLFATVIIKEIVPEVPIIARVNAAENVERTHHAGADFALSISQVSGKILASRLLRQEAIELDTKLRLLEVDAPGLAGRHPAALDIRGRSGCSVVAVERGEDLILDFGSDFLFGAEDTIYICGTREATRRFSEVYS